MDVEDRVRRAMLEYGDQQSLTGGELHTLLTERVDSLTQSQFLSEISAAIEARLHELRED